MIRLVTTITSLAVLATCARSQCMSIVGIRGADGPAYAAARWDPDGAGPIPMHYVVGGKFRTFGLQRNTAIGTMPSVGNRVTTTLTVPGVTDDVFALHVLPDNQLIAAGAFPGGVARWTGTAWEVIGGGINGRGTCLASSSTGQLLVGGAFTQAGGLPASNVAIWNGTAWSNLGGGIQGPVYSIAGLPGGRTVVGGDFGDIAGQSLPALAMWDGAAWSAIAPGGANGPVYALLYDAPSDSLFAAGGFTSIAGVPAGRIARYQNGTWSRLGQSGLSGPVYALSINPDNRALSAGGAFAEADQRPASGLASLSLSLANASWVPSSEVINGPVRSIATGIVVGEFRPQSANQPGNAYAPGWYDDPLSPQPVATSLGRQVGPGFERFVSGALGREVWRFDGTAWSVQPFAFTSSTFRQLFAVTRMPNGRARAVNQQTILELQDGTWQPVAPNIPAPVAVGGAINQAGEASMIQLGTGANPSNFTVRAYWNGTWNFLETITTSSSVRDWYLSTAVSPAGDVFVAIQFFTRFTSAAGVPVSSSLLRHAKGATTWTSVQPADTTTSHAFALMQGVNDSIVAIRLNGFNEDGLAVWNGSHFVNISSDFGPASGATDLNVLYVAPSDIIIHTDLSYPGMSIGPRFMRWNGSTWNQLPLDPSLRLGDVSSITPFPDGSLLIEMRGGVEPFVHQYRLVPPVCCDSIDFNRNNVFPEDQDVIDFFTVLAGGECATCSDIDFNNNTVFPEDQDVIDFFTVLGGGTCR